MIFIKKSDKLWMSLSYPIDSKGGLVKVVDAKKYFKYYYFHLFLNFALIIFGAILLIGVKVSDEIIDFYYYSNFASIIFIFWKVMGFNRIFLSSADSVRRVPIMMGLNFSFAYISVAFLEISVAANLQGLARDAAGVLGVCFFIYAFMPFLNWFLLHLKKYKHIKY
nr:hypothetical protein [uncultured Albidiferax sp.]